MSSVNKLLRKSDRDGTCVTHGVRPSASTSALYVLPLAPHKKTKYIKD